MAPEKLVAELDIRRSLSHAVMMPEPAGALASGHPMVAVARPPRPTIHP
jgi:hypothetical protein